MSEPSRTPGPESYGPEYFSEVYGHETLGWHEMGWWSVRFYAKLADRILRGRSSRRYLEIGCGYGHILAWLHDRHECYGVDISEHAVGKARENAPQATIVAADVAGELSGPLAGKRFDLILARYVLEHLPQPEPVIRRCAELLADDGLLLFSVPNTQSPGRRMKGDAWFGFGDETHVSLLSPAEWLDMTRSNGLTIEREFSDGLWDIPYVSWLPSVLQYPLFCVPTAVSVLFARPMLPVSWGENLIVVAKKTAGGKS